MSKYTVKFLTGRYILVIMNSPTDFLRIPQKIDLALTFHEDIIAPVSKEKLLAFIKIVQRDLKSAETLIAAHWYDDSGKAACVEKEFEYNVPDDKGHIIDSHTYPITTLSELREFMWYLETLAAENQLSKAPNAYTPLLKSKAIESYKHQPEEMFEQVKETGIVARLFGCCFGA